MRRRPPHLLGAEPRIYRAAGDSGFGRTLLLAHWVHRPSPGVILVSGVIRSNLGRPGTQARQRIRKPNRRLIAASSLLRRSPFRSLGVVVTRRKGIYVRGCLSIPRYSREYG